MAASLGSPENFSLCKQKLARKALMDISESVCGRLPAENTLIRRLKAKKVLTEPEANRLQAMTVYEERDAELVDVISKKDADCIFQFINMMQDDSVCCGLHSLFDAYCAHFEKRVNHFLHERCEIAKSQIPEVAGRMVVARGSEVSSLEYLETLLENAAKAAKLRVDRMESGSMESKFSHSGGQHISMECSDTKLAELIDQNKVLKAKVEDLEEKNRQLCEEEEEMQSSKKGLPEKSLIEKEYLKELKEKHFQDVARLTASLKKQTDQANLERKCSENTIKLLKEELAKYKMREDNWNQISSARDQECTRLPIRLSNTSVFRSDVFLGKEASFQSISLCDVNFGVRRGTLLLSGRNVYVCGGSAENPDMSRRVQVYNLHTLSCYTMDPAPFYDCEAVMIEGHLTLLGGLDGNEKLTKKLVTWLEHEWKEIYPSMPNFCYRPGVLTHQDYLIVSGGHKEVGHFDIMKISTRTWWTAAHLNLPQPLLSHNLALCGPTLYAVGGAVNTTPSSKVFSLPWSKVEKAMNGQHMKAKSAWSEVKSLPHLRSTPLPFSSMLLSVGGSDQALNPTAEILLFDPDLKKWKVIGHLQIARIRPSVLPISSTSCMVMCGTGSSDPADLLKSVELIQIA